MNQPFFSILIPCYNAKDYIEKAIDSCVNQKFQDFEIIIVDNASTDGTLEKIKNINYNKIKLLSQSYRINDIELKNFLIQKSNGKYIIWLEPFDKITDFFLEKAYNILQYKHYDILEFSMMWSHDDKKIDISYVNDVDYFNNSCLQLYLNRIDNLQDMFVGKVFSSELMKKLKIQIVYDVYEYSECFYSMDLYLNAKSYKSFSDIFVYDYHIDIYRNQQFNCSTLESIKNLCRIRNEQLIRNVKILKENNLYNKYALYILNKLYLFNIFQDMLKIENIEDRKMAFKEFYKYFTIQLSANILLEDNNESY